MSNEEKPGCSCSVGAVSVGSILAAFLSVVLNQSFWWALLHFFCGWFYVLYALACRHKEIWPAMKNFF